MKEEERSKQKDHQEPTEPEGKSLTPKEERFCYEYCIDLNAAAAAVRSGYSKRSARSIGHENLTKQYIKDKIFSLQKNISETAGVTALRLVLEHKKIAFSSFTELHVTWIKRKDFEELTEDQKACIAEIDTKVKTEWEYNPETKRKEPVPVEYVKTKLYDKQKALESLAKLFGYDAPTKMELIGTLGISLTKEEIKKISEQLENEC
jgi:phage terminase small subunit